jgi:hypothetical protein
MTRTLALTLAGVLAFAGSTRAQYFPATREMPEQSQRLINNRVDTQRRTTTPSLAAAPPSTTSDPRFYPLASLRQIFVAELGREPSEAEAAYWLRQLNYMTRDQLAITLRTRQPLTWVGHYDPRLGPQYDPGAGSSPYPDPASLNFRDPGGPYFNSPYFPNYERRRPIRTFPLHAEG